MEETLPKNKQAQDQQAQDKHDKANAKSKALELLHKGVAELMT